MPEQKVGLTQLFAFGAGVAVGANWPRASNIVGYILQRLGFEMTDLTLWMWDPEKSGLQRQEGARVGREKAKKGAQGLRLRAGSSSRKTRAKSRKTKRSPGIQSDAAGSRAVRKNATNGQEPWIAPVLVNGASRTNGSYVNSRLILSEHPGSQGARRKSKTATVDSKRKNPATRRGGKIRTLSSTVLAADAALN